MQSFVVWNDKIVGRLDCFFYSPKNQVSIKSKFPLVTVKDVTHNVIHPPEYKRIYVAYGYQLLRAQNVKPLGIEINSNKVFLDKNYLKGKKLISPEIGDVLVVRSGVNTGDCAVIEKDYVDLILGADNLVCKCNDKINPFFLKTYLSLNIGRKILSLYQTGATNYHITPENLKKIKIPLPPLSIQNQIVDIMQSAYTQKKEKEAEAQRLLDSIDDYVLDELGIKLPEVEEKMCFVVNSEEVQSNRFDAYYRQPKFEEVEKAIKRGKFEVKNGEDLFVLIESGKGISPEQFTYKGIGFLEVKNIGFIGISLPDFYVQEENKLKYVQKGDILTGRVGSIGSFALYDIEDNLAFSDNVLRIKCIASISNLYLTAILNSILVKIQIDRSKKGSLQNVINRLTLNDLRIPLPSLEIQKKIAEEVKRRISEAERLKAEASRIVEEAKKKVEGMILGD